MDTERRHIRDGFHTVTPYLSVRDAPALIAFLDAVFAAEDRRRDRRPDGTIMNAEMRIGDSVVEPSQVAAGESTTPAALHVYSEFHRYWPAYYAAYRLASSKIQASHSENRCM